MIWIIRGLILLIVGGLLVSGSLAMQPLLPSLLPLGAGISLTEDADRIGRAATAPAMRRCVPAMGFDRTVPMEPSAAYFALKSAGWQANLRTLLGKSKAEQEGHQPYELALKWGQLAGCIFAQEPRSLCDLDNRAAAVETLTRFVLYARQADALLQEATTAARDDLALEDARYNIGAARERLLASLRSQWRDGIFVISDFGVLPPGEIRQVMREEKEARNLCRG